MSCGFCHLGPSPLHPPADPSKPEFSNINSTVGAQYLWMDRVFVWSGDTKKFLYQLMHSYPPGTMDTSLVSTDYINNPAHDERGLLCWRSGWQQSLSWGKETLKGGELNNKQHRRNISRRRIRRGRHAVLKDGSDSVGVMGALNRVYLNIGLYSEDWMTHFNPFFGGKKITPIEIATAEKGSPYWKATEIGTFKMAALPPQGRSAGPPRGRARRQGLSHRQRGHARSRQDRVRRDLRTLPFEQAADRGARQAWTRSAARDRTTCLLESYWAYTKTDEFKAKMREIVQKPDFLEHNYLSTDARIPATLLRTNACSPLATNAIRGNIWDNFSSSTYKNLPSVGNDHGAGPGQPGTLAFPDAGRRTRLHARAFTGEHLVDGAVPGQ